MGPDGWCVGGVGGEGGRGKGSVVIWNGRGGWSGRNIYKWKVDHGGENGSKLESSI